jgi:hypothetical protein
MKSTQVRAPGRLRSYDQAKSVSLLNLVSHAGNKIQMRQVVYTHSASLAGMLQLLPFGAMETVIESRHVYCRESKLTFRTHLSLEHVANFLPNML